MCSSDLNFYAPNIFTKDIHELDEKILSDNNKCKFDIDIMIISAISIDTFEENCLNLAKYVNPNTVVLLSSDFGCELETTVIKIFNGKCKCVMLISCEMECRQLSLGSYALVNDDNCVIFLGISYQTNHYSTDLALIENEKLVKQELQMKLTADTKLNKFIELLKVANWIEIETMLDSKQMALKLWDLRALQ